MKMKKAARRRAPRGGQLRGAAQRLRNRAAAPTLPRPVTMTSATSAVAGIDQSR